MSEPTLSELQARVAHFVEARRWQPYHNPKNLVLSIAIEAAELMEHFQWLTVEESKTRLQTPEVREAVALELADVLIYALSFAESAGIDPAEAIAKKLALNEERFPASSVSGKLGTKPGGGHESR